MVSIVSRALASPASTFEFDDRSSAESLVDEEISHQEASQCLHALHERTTIAGRSRMYIERKRSDQSDPRSKGSLFSFLSLDPCFLSQWHELDRHVQQRYYDMARDERLRHMQLYPEWSARDNYGVKKKRTIKGKKRDKLTGDPNAGQKMRKLTSFRHRWRFQNV